MKSPNEHLPQKQEPIDRILAPFADFAKIEASGGIVLIATTVCALIWANSPWSEAYESLWQTKVSLGFGSAVLSKPLILWINDGLMAIFFFVVGLEIKREVLVGELSQARQAALPIAAAIGGMVVPALIYFAFNPENPELSGWGIPMATDIAFSLGVLALLGKRVPLSAKIFLTAFAIVDDIGASLIIAVFYTDEIWFAALGTGGGLFAAMIAANRLGVRKPLVYAILGFGLWLAFLKSGVHPTIAGILAAMTIPARTRVDTADFLTSSRKFLDEFEKNGGPGINVLTNQAQWGSLQALENAADLSQTPLQRLEHDLHLWVSYFIMPIFALANAGVVLSGDLGSTVTSSVSLGVIAGLLIGKPIGITLLAWIAAKAGIAQLPEGLTWRHVFGLAWLGAIGFTMSLFIANLAFDGAAALPAAKVGILIASIVAGVVGWWILKGATPATQDKER